MLYNALNIILRRIESCFAIKQERVLVLREIVLHPSCAQRKIVEATGLSLGSVNSAAKSLTAPDSSPIWQRPTGSRHGSARPYRVENAYRHLAARPLVPASPPISYEKPKGLLKVRGGARRAPIRQLCSPPASPKYYRGRRLQEGVLFSTLRQDKFGVSIVVESRLRLAQQQPPSSA